MANISFIEHGVDIPASALQEELGLAFDEVPTVLLVEPLAKLLFAGSLGELMLLARWQGALDIFGHWPRRHWADATAGKQYVPMAAPMTTGMLQSLAGDLRRWSKRIVTQQHLIDGVGRDDGLNDGEQALESHLLALDKFAQELAPPPQRARPPRKKYTGSVLLASVSTGRLLKTLGSLKTMVFDKLTQVLPPGLSSLLQDLRASGSLALPTWDSRLLLVVDVALMLHRRRRAADVPCVRYGLADSSLQASHDWLISRARRSVLIK